MSSLGMQLDGASHAARTAMSRLNEAAKNFADDDDRSVMLRGLAGVAAGLVDTLNGIEDAALRQQGS